MYLFKTTRAQTPQAIPPGKELQPAEVLAESKVDVNFEINSSGERSSIFSSLLCPVYIYML